MTRKQTTGFRRWVARAVSGWLVVEAVPFERLARFRCAGPEAWLARMSRVASSEGDATSSPTN